MDIIEAINKRKSIRAFRPDPVPKTVLTAIVELAMRAPSWANTQPCELAIASGTKLEEVKQGCANKVKETPYPDIALMGGFPEIHLGRRQALGAKLLEMAGIAREDKEGRQLWLQKGLTLFGAPAVIYILVDRSLYFHEAGLNVWPLFDCGLVAENIMLLATDHGLGTIPQVQAVYYPDILRGVLGIPESKLIVLGISIGYVNWGDPVNQWQSEREPLDKTATWYGFD